MKTAHFPGHDPLSDSELDRLDAFLSERGGSQTMNVEELDGFFAALVVGPELVLASEYLPMVWGQGEDAGAAFENLEEANAIVQLMMRHWNTIAAAVEREELYLPVMLESDAGIQPGHRWARGFMKGVGLRRESWADLAQDEAQGGSLLAIAALAAEVDPELLSRPLSSQQSDELVQRAVGGMNWIARHFSAARRANAQPRSGRGTVRREVAKVRRNEPCPCGSGRKYKQCCGRGDGPLVH